MKSSKLFLMAVVAMALGAFALVGCEPAKDEATTPDVTGTTGSNTAAPEEPTSSPEGGETKSTEGGDMKGGEAATPEGGEAKTDAAPTDEKPADDGHGHAEGEGH
jgi:hypothetical protein